MSNFFAFIACRFYSNGFIASFLGGADAAVAAGFGGVTTLLVKEDVVVDAAALLFETGCATRPSD